MAPDYDHLTLMQKVEVFEHALSNTNGDDLAKLLWLKSPSSEVTNVKCLRVPWLISEFNNLKSCTRPGPQELLYVRFVDIRFIDTTPKAYRFHKSCFYLCFKVWFDRRTNYTRSLAVMSMVGYVLGLGDR